LLWKPPWQLPALVAFIDVGLDDVADDDADEDHEHKAEDIPVESIVPYATAPPALTKDTERQLFKTELKKQVIRRDPFGSELLHRLEGKPNYKKGGMSGTIHAMGRHHAMGRVAYWACQKPTQSRNNSTREHQRSSRGASNKLSKIESFSPKLLFIFLPNSLFLSIHCFSIPR